jgi:hypothetical protein
MNRLKSRAEEFQILSILRINKAKQGRFREHPCLLSEQK